MSSSVWFKSSHSSMPDYFHPGSEHVGSSLKELGKCTVKVKRLCISETPLQQGPLQALGIIGHDFLVVEVSAVEHPRDGDLNKGLKIRAEKTGWDGNGKNTGIHVKEIHFVSEDNITELSSIDTYDVSVPMDQLLKILTKHCADYDILSDNCWKYADNTLRDLVKEFGKLHPEFADAMNERVQYLDPPIMPKVVIAGAVVATVATVATVGLYKALSAHFGSDAEEESEWDEE